MPATFSGVWQYVAWGPHLDGFDWRTQPLTVCGWVRVSAGGPWATIVGNEINVSPYTGWSFYIETGTGKLWANMIQQHPGKSFVVHSTNDSGAGSGEWNFVALRKTAGHDVATIEVLVALGAAGALTSLPMTTVTNGPHDGPSVSGGTLDVASRRTTFLWAGGLDDVRVYGRALSDDELTDIYTLRGADAVRDGLVFRPRLGGAAVGSTIVPIDLGPSGYTPTVVGSPVVAEGAGRRP